jgi:predicted ATPase
MSIARLHIHGFRSLNNTTWTPGKLNILIGPNGAGKSNLLRGLELLRRTAEAELDDALTQQGGIDSILWDRQAKEVSFDVQTDFPRAQSDDLRSPSERLRYFIDVEPVGLTGTYRVKRELLDGGVDSIPTFDREAAQSTIRIGGYARQLKVFESALGTIRAGSRDYELGSAGFIKDYFSSWRTYQDLRVDYGAELRQAAVAQYQRVLDPNGQNLIPVLHTLYTEEPPFEDAIDSGMRAGFGKEFRKLLFAPAADNRIQLRIRFSSLRHAPSAAELSAGTLRFLILLTIFNTAEQDSLIAIDEPEASLHPSMLKVVADYAAEAALRSQIVLATQSTELLDALTPHRPKITVAQLMDGQTQLRNVDDDELKRWLSEYTLGSLQRSGELEEMP